VGALSEKQLREWIERLAAIERGSASPGEAQAARLIADEVSAAGAPARLEPERAQDLGRALGLRSVEIGEELEVLGDGQAWIESCFVPGIGHAPPEGLVGSRDRVAVVLGSPGRGDKQSRQHSQERRLSGSVLSKDTDDALCDLQVDAIERQRASVGDAQRRKADHLARTGDSDPANRRLSRARRRRHSSSLHPPPW